ncbi:MAG: hypothetical protein RI897_3770 [Verrucomicrobiota bacterium]|jgi:hypothetical protein
MDRSVNQQGDWGWVLWLWAVLLALVCGGGLQAAVQMTAVVQPQVVPMGAEATFQLRFEGGLPEQLPNAPEVPGLRVRYDSQGSETTVANGVVRRSFVASYKIQPLEVGDYVIPSLRAAVGGREVVSNPVSLKVVKSDLGNGEAEPFFLTVSLPKASFYVGEATVATMILHSQYGGQLESAPELVVEGAVLGDLVALENPQPISTNGVVYQRGGWQMPVTFMKAGEIGVRAAGCQLAVQFRTQRQRDPFGFPSLFGDVEVRRFTLASGELKVRVNSLPREGRPEGFAGAVGRFQLEASVSSTNVAVGDPLTLSVRLSGSGNLESMRWAAPTNWPGWRAYEPTSNLEVSDRFGQVGVRTVEQVLVPQSSGLGAVPPIRFAYFDPFKDAYQVVDHPGFGLAVSEAVAGQAVATVTRRAESADSEKVVQDIVHIKSQPGVVGVLAVPMALRPWMVLGGLLPVVLWGMVRGWRWQKERLASDPRGMRKREVQRRVRAGLAELEAKVRAGDAAGFHSELFRLLQEVLGERLDMPAASITGDVVEGWLRPPGMEEALVDRVERLFRECDQARYAPGGSAGKLAEELGEVRSVLEDLQKMEVRRDV